MPLVKRRSRSKVEQKRQFTMSSNSSNATTSADPTSNDDSAAVTSSSGTPSSSSTPVDADTSTTESSSTPPPTTSSSSSSDPPTSTPESSTSSPTSTPTPTTSSTTTPTPTPTPSSTSTSSEPSSSEAPTSSTVPSTSSPTSTPFTSISTIIDGTSTETTTITSFATKGSGTGTSTSTSASGTATFISGGGGSSGSLTQPGKIAVAVVVPIAGVALIVLAGLFFWRRRKQRRDAEEERRKEVEDYAYNPNNDPTVPNVAGAGTYEMKEDASSGYRGWGSTTLAGSTGRKASTTMSGAGATFSDGTSAQGNFSDTRSGEPLMSDGSHSPEGEILGAMGPPSADNRPVNVHRGPSNASSSYSAAGRSDGSGENPTYGSAGYYEQYGANNPYSDPYSDNPNGPVQPVIRDNPARRNTRIENPSPYPQQSAGISQNF
ncbi:hypothetical protein E0Z10_g1932 [Xylaria hypoxylon]|uniref:REJ domain-containing protein n=1 Tax=Xylaria hypoxylon TaxID=37992 RepID=A0A4Z0Z3G2_9PEZI|nr:hypothetical protein E0Z10_g1932 [Xylaria hypoxylon]